MASVKVWVRTVYRQMAVDSSVMMVTQLRMAPEMMPFAIMGTVIWKKVLALEEPSEMAASSMLMGICCRMATDERILLFPARAACHKRAALATYRRIGGLIAIIPKDWKYLRGDIYYADMEPHIGSEQGGTRPVVVLQNDVGNRYAPTLIVATVTSRTEKKRYQPTHVLIAHNTAFEKPSVVQLEQIFTIDKSRIQRFLGQTTRHEMRRIEEALMNSLEINEWDRRNADE